MKKILLIIITIILIGCQKELEAERACFVSIEEFKYLSNNEENVPFSQDYQSTRISDCWVTFNGLFLGAFEMPSTIPVLFNGEINAKISPGIKVNGTSLNRIIYPFYKEYEISTEINFEENNILNPTTEYKENTNFQLLEEGTFELGNMLEKTENSDTIPFTQNEEVFQGQKSCAIRIDNENPFFQIKNIEPLFFENFFESIFIELDFKSSIPFSVGLITNEDLANRQEHMIIFASNEWKKMYLDISPLIGTEGAVSSYQIYFEGNLPENTESGFVILDNIKIVH